MKPIEDGDVDAEDCVCLDDETMKMLLMRPRRMMMMMCLWLWWMAVLAGPFWLLWMTLC